MQIALSDLNFLSFVFSVSAFRSYFLSIETKVSCWTNKISFNRQLYVFSIHFDLFVSEVVPIETAWIFFDPCLLLFCEQICECLLINIIPHALDIGDIELSCTV